MSQYTSDWTFAQCHGHLHNATVTVDSGEMPSATSHTCPHWRTAFLKISSDSVSLPPVIQAQETHLEANNPQNKPCTAWHADQKILCPAGGELSLGS